MKDSDPEPSALSVQPGVSPPLATVRRKPIGSARPSPEVLAEEILKGSRRALSQAITLVESHRPDHQALCQAMWPKLLPFTGKSVRVGISGVPGVGKSTLIEALGQHILADPDSKLAVLAVDPSSPLTKGSILGDKSRMSWLSNQERAYIRPSPSQGTLGGVAAKTREVMLLCEAAGYNTIIVETVGVGQSEATVSSLVDCFLLLLLPGSGDEVQGIKKGVLELADILAVTKADGDNLIPAKVAQSSARTALHLTGREAEVFLCSALSGDGLPEIWQSVVNFGEAERRSGNLERNRSAQDVTWFHELVKEQVVNSFYQGQGVEQSLSTLADQIAQGLLTPRAACERLFASLPR